MKKALAVTLTFAALIALVAVVAVSGWFAFRAPRVEVSWCPDWPKSIRGVGEATERILPGADGKVTEADRARASERARWKAWYYAQLRLAEQVGSLRITAATSVRDMNLTDQALDAAYSGTLHAAREVERESRVEVKKDVVLARVVVESPAERVLSLRESLLAALRSGRIRLSPTETTKVEPARSESSKTAASSRPVANAPVHRQQPARAAISPAQPDATGCVIVLDTGSGFIGASPSFRDAAGTPLGTALDLPEERLVAGVPVADATDTTSIASFAGKNPIRLEASIRGGDVVLRDKLDEGRRAFFAGALKSGKIVLVLSEKGA